MLCVAYKLLIFCCVQMCPIMLKMRICWMGDTHIGSLHRFVSRTTLNVAAHGMWSIGLGRTALPHNPFRSCIDYGANATHTHTKTQRNITNSQTERYCCWWATHSRAIPLSPATRISIWSYVKINLPWSLYNFRFCSPQTIRCDVENLYAAQTEAHMLCDLCELLVNQLWYILCDYCLAPSCTTIPLGFYSVFCCCCCAENSGL